MREQLEQVSKTIDNLDYVAKTLPAANSVLQPERIAEQVAAIDTALDSVKNIEAILTRSVPSTPRLQAPDTPPVDTVDVRLIRLLQSSENPGLASIGLQIEYNEETDQCHVKAIAPGSPAAGKISAGQRLLRVDGQHFSSFDQVRSRIQGPLNSTVVLTLDRQQPSVAPHHQQVATHVCSP